MTPSFSHFKFSVSWIYEDGVFIFDDIALFPGGKAIPAVRSHEEYPMVEGKLFF